MPAGVLLVDRAMALVDPNFEQHRQTWIGFTRVVRYAMAVIILS